MNNQIAGIQSQPELVTKSSIVYNERRGATFKQNDVINISIPPSLSLINCKNTYLRIRLKMTGNLKKCPSTTAGAYGMFRNITISDGSGQTILEQLDQYGYMESLRQFYSKNESIHNLRMLHEGLPNSLVMRDNRANQYCDPTKSTGSEFNKEVECLLPLHLSGCLSPNRDTVWKNVATNGLRIRIDLHDALTACTTITVPIYDQSGNEIKTSTLQSHGNFTQAGGGGYGSGSAYELQETAVATDTTIVLKNTSDLLTAAQGCLSPDSGTPGHVFAVGQTVRFNNAVDKVIESINMIGSRIQLTIPAITAAEAANFNIDSTCFVKVDSLTMPSEDFEIQDVAMIVSYVVPPMGYIEDVLSQISKGLEIDIKTYQDYPVNIANNSLNNSLYLNARNTRAKSILSVPYTSSSNEYIEDSYIPDRQTIRDYQWIMYNVLTPDRRVDCSRFNLESFNAVALREQMHSLASAAIPVNNVLDNYKHFFIGRRLSMDNYSYNMNRPQQGEVRLNVNFSSMVGVLIHSFVVHLRRIQITPQGITIVY